MSHAHQHPSSSSAAASPQGARPPHTTRVPRGTPDDPWMEMQPLSAYDPASHAPGRRPVSVLVLTKNEEVNIEACLSTLNFSDDIVVLDSFSTDRTCELSKKFPNVRVIQRKFDTWSKHSNWALENIPFKHPWVYYSDADERVTPELHDEVIRVANDTAQPHVAFRLRYKNIFLGHWIRRGGLYPVWIIRLFMPDKIRYEDREVNAHPVMKGTLGDLKEHFIHYSFNKGLVPWFIKHNSYSDMESKEAVRVIESGAFNTRCRQLLSRQPGVARRAMKDLSFYLRLRFFARFIYMYVFRAAFLDGTAGFHYALMISMYEYWIEVKIRERRFSWRERTERAVAAMLAGPSTDSALSAPRAAGEPKIDIMIPTLNEAAHIRETVLNARLLGNVFVLDSFSTDGTQQIARDAGATVVEHAFENYSKQKNWGLDNLPMTGDWVFIIDADERITPELAKELRDVAKKPDAAEGYFVNRVVIMMGRAIRHGGMLPSWNLRFFKRGKCRYEDRTVHEHMVCDGRTEYLSHLMLHIRRETISEYLAKHIKYADMESDEWIKMRVGRDQAARAHRLFRDLPRYRLYLRRDYWPRVPLKPLVRFVYMYVFRLGFLDGAPGWHLSCLMASYEYMISLLYREKQQRLKDGLLSFDPVSGRVVATVPPSQ
ncbi:MAG: glycosyltransferase family 2 protein [Phycisphaerales bacterium]|nr:glycosyltransferase family 2 protein [Phycisphaerales bacterium]